MISRSIIYSLTNFVNEYREELKKRDTFAVFNEWQTLSQVSLDFDEAVWASQYIKQILECDADLIKEALMIDAKCIDKEFRNTKGPKLQSRYPATSKITVSQGFNYSLSDYLDKYKDCLIISLYQTGTETYEFKCYYKEVKRLFFGKSIERDRRLFYLDAVAHTLRQVKRPCVLYLLTDSPVDIISKDNHYIKDIKNLVEEKKIQLNIVVFNDTDKVRKEK